MRISVTSKYYITTLQRDETPMFSGFLHFSLNNFCCVLNT